MLAPRYLVKCCKFYPYLSLETVFQALKMTQIYCVNVNIYFLQNWQLSRVKCSRFHFLILYIYIYNFIFFLFTCNKYRFYFEIYSNRKQSVEFLCSWAKRLYIFAAWVILKKLQVWLAITGNFPSFWSNFIY